MSLEGDDSWPCAEVSKSASLHVWEQYASPEVNRSQVKQ